MDDSFKDLEAELKGLRLRQPSAQLFSRLERELVEEVPDAFVSPPRPRRYTSATNLGSWIWSGWRMAGMAAAAVALCATIGVVIYKQDQGPVAKPSFDVAATAPENSGLQPAGLENHAVTAGVSSRYRPVAATNVLYDVEDEAYLPDDGYSRRVRARYIDTYTWENPKTNSSLKWSVPREEVRVIPASWN